MTITDTAPTTDATTPTDSKVLVGLTHSSDEPENVLIAYLMGVEALRAGKQAVMWLTKDAVEIAVEGFAATIDIPGAPSVQDLHDEYVDRGGSLAVQRIRAPLCASPLNS